MADTDDVSAFYGLGFERDHLARLLDGLAALEGEPTLLGVSAHLLGVARRS